ncbi:hypothetical protein N7492_006359 [Penicillium capsulatum]|uniref:Developmental and secondary metabolism regulator veA n=1 Tax=Penicillium capsulatum TaxID=69766 RepID=A0A9W9I3Q7_9EURO|nr:hypothetical protein N7492_006359 [Penicillium capsulatum]KAJ6109008.1 hypothetical protein N7512_008845 [Penicillium capsulatum]
MAARPTMIAPHNETESSTYRITREGKQITYKLSVMQQPERARACGAGAKSSADRRPVDPPPVVELRIFESEPGNEAQMTDITFAYNANFFLYATLDTARPIAHGRVAGPPSCPVLTGVPVAGVAYLDRPSQAGYFIFPDLSVRHEGRYRLSFHLYEEIKNVKDADKDSNAPLPNQIGHPLASKPGSPQAFLNFRLEVKTVPFTVYSAKKFPGLATSTNLSHVIAEQGCRVRIRRDVRMRRRGDKREEEYDFDEERAAALVYARSGRYSTPDRYAAPSVERPRSNSNTSTMESPYGFGPEIQRRPSGNDYGFQYPKAYQRPIPVVPMPHAQTPSYQSYLSFGSTPTQYPAPHMPPTPPPIAPSGMYSPHTSYANIRHPSVSDYDASPTGYPMASLKAERTGYPKNTMTSYHTEAPKMSPYMDLHMPDPTQFQPMPQQVMPPWSSGTARLIDPGSGPDYITVHPSIESSVGMSSPTPGYENVSGKRMLYHTGPTVMKRSHEESFGIDDRSMQNGMRPDSETYPSAYRDFSAESRAALMAELGVDMAYKRANGRIVVKAPLTVQ